jgi:phenylpropionate dioxygenase-like ring-hydroxylating dioxygenase large terminal subunit
MNAAVSTPAMNTENRIRRACAAALENAEERTARQGRGRGLGEILDEIQQTADLPLELSRTLPGDVYISEEFYAWEITNVFKPGWFCVAHVSQIPNNGDFLRLDLLGEPLIVVRGKDAAVRVLSRVCPHRGMDILPPYFNREDFVSPAQGRNGDSSVGHTRLFLCPYHSWTFELNGQLKACPEMHQATDFCRDEIALAEHRSAIWNGFVFINFDGTAPALDSWLAEMNADFGDWNAAEMKLVISREWDCPFNWKVLSENFMESYHHAGAHLKTLQPLMPARDTWNEQERSGYIRCHLPYKHSLLDQWDEQARAGAHPFGFPTIERLPAWKKRECGLFMAFPAFLTFTLPDRLVWYRLQPIGPHRMKLLTTVLVPETTTTHSNFEEMLERETKMLIDFHAEDMEMCTAIQRGMYSMSAPRGRLSHLEMSVWLLQRFLAARARGTWPAMDRPAAQSQR